MVKCIHCEKEVMPIKGVFSWGWFVGGAILWVFFVGLLSYAATPSPFSLLAGFFSFPAWLIIYTLYHLIVKRPVICAACGKNAYKKVKKWKGVLRGGWEED